MLKLSRFTNSLNQAFGSNIAIPRGQDYPYLRKALGESFDDKIAEFKSCCISHPKRNVLSEVTGVSFPSSHKVGGETLFFIEFTADKKTLKGDTVEFYGNSAVPSVKFTRTEFETFTLFHEIGHSTDRAATYYDVSSSYDVNKDLAWQRECFADYFATLMMTKAAGPSFAEERLIPFRALSPDYIYQTSSAIREAVKLSKTIYLETMSEKEILDVALSSWNKISPNTIVEWSRNAEKNLSAILIIKGSVKCNGIGNLIKSFPGQQKEMHQKMLNTLGEFLSENCDCILKNSVAFRAPLKNIRAIESCLMRDIQRGEMPSNREKVYDGPIDRYLRRFPDCEIIKNKISYQINAAI